MLSRNQLLALISMFFEVCHCSLSIDNDLGFGRWFRPTLTYSIRRYPDSRQHPRLTPSAMRRYVDLSMEKATSLWRPVVNVEFKCVDSDDADIKVWFYSGDHGDGYSFDGKGGEVGHTFYPDEPTRGQIHIDDDEPWAPDGRNLEWTLAHELGHALGIPHQAGPSLMEYGYRGFMKRPELTDIDRTAATKLYRS